MKAFENIVDLIDAKKSFVLEAGAGSGKTFTLIQTLNYLLEKYREELRFHHKTVVCITYTNVAKNEILDRLENNPLVEVLTIHEFLWAKIKSFQKQLLLELDILNEQMSTEKPDKFIPGLLRRGKVSEVIYNDTSFRDFEIGHLHHDDVIALAAALFSKYPLLTSIISAKHPYIFIDEYQDTAKETVSALVDSLLQQHRDKVLLGFYGDSYQKIYDTGIGSLDEYIQSGKLELVNKEENYRSSCNVISLLNKVRRNIQQIVPEGIEKQQGSVTFINCNNYPEKGKKEKITEYEKSIVPLKNQNYQKVIDSLSACGWNFGKNSKDKVLLIANSRVAERGEFGKLYRITAQRYGDRANDALMKRENVLVRFFLGAVDKKTSKERKSGIEHLLSYWSNREYNYVMAFLNKYGQIKRDIPVANDNYFFLRKHIDKVLLSERLTELESIGDQGTVKDVFDFTINNRIVSIPEGLSKFLKKIQSDLATIEDDEERERQEKDLKFYNDVMALPYLQFKNLFKHTQNQSVFSTKHGTKGDEFRNVLVVIDDTSWKQMYNFESFIDGSEEKPERKLRTKNLFYVSCSRAIENLVVLALSEMKQPAMAVVTNWFQPENTRTINDFR